MRRRHGRPVRHHQGQERNQGLHPRPRLIAYQEQVQKEQVQKAAQIIAGYSLGEAEILRRVMGKMKPEELATNFVLFSDARPGRPSRA
ncbi:hypothetical protein ABT237_27290 [Streptomyces sp. NPDC001581]|uniref:hypothetical protein n=1 Tax=Streptomyces sp. NPDC001581 TaxID=3154386 RepID=UPI003318248E